MRSPDLRQALILPGGMLATPAQCELMLEGALHACERYYPALQFVTWAGKTASEAMTTINSANDYAGFTI